MEKITALFIDGERYEVLSIVTGTAYDGNSGFGFYVCQKGKEVEFTLVPFDAGMCPFDTALFSRSAEVTPVE